MTDHEPPSPDRIPSPGSRRPTVVSPVEAAFRTEWPKIVATLTRELGDLQLAEDMAGEAFAEASRVWRTGGVPHRPGAWLLTTARRRAIDRLRRDRRFEDRIPHLAADLERQPETATLVDDQLALIFGCCHPALDDEARVALTLRSIGGLSTAQIARAFLVPEPTMAKRLVRAKKKIRAAGIPFTIPARDQLDARIDAVCGVIYAVFTEGHTASTGSAVLRGTLCDEAIWLAETLAGLMPDHDEVRALAALCLLTDARRATRTDDRGWPILLADQDRDRWNHDRIRDGMRHLVAAGAHAAHPGPYRLRAIVAAAHAGAPRYADTDWGSIIAVYRMMRDRGGGAIVELNLAVAIGERDGPAAGLAELDRVLASGQLDEYHYLHAARAELLRRSGAVDRARDGYARAIECCTNDAERAWLADRQDRLIADV